MDRVPTQTLIDFIDKRYAWGNLTPTMAESLVKEIIFIRAAIDACIDDMYEANSECRDVIDMMNELVHRKPIKPNYEKAQDK